MVIVVILVFAKDPNHVADLYEEINRLSKAFYEYFEKNWKNCEEMWIRSYRNELAILDTHTNNHIEVFNRTIKRFIKPSMHLSETIELLSKVNTQYAIRQSEYMLKNLKSLTASTIKMNPVLEKLEKHVSFRGEFFFNLIWNKRVSKGMRILTDEMKLFELGYNVTESIPDKEYRVREYIVCGCTEKSKNHLVKLDESKNSAHCDCTTFSGFRLFCRHILGVFNANPRFDPARYLENSDIRWKPEHQEIDSATMQAIDDFKSYQNNILAKKDTEKGKIIVIQVFKFQDPKKQKKTSISILKNT